MENGGKMENPGEIYQLCRLCLANNQVNVPIFGEKSDIRQISLKISSCLPIRIAVDDSLPKNICEGCSDKLELFYAFWNSSQEADKTLRAWIEQINNAGEAMAEVVKQISNSEGIPLIAEVKEETEDLAEDDPDKVIINQPFDDDEDVDEKESEDAPPAKRAKLSPTVEESGINQESDDDVDEEYDVDEVEPKVEDESDMSDSDEDAPLSSRLADMPGTSKDEEQAGPSGVGKDGEKYNPFVKEEMEIDEEYIIENIRRENKEEVKGNTLVKESGTQKRKMMCNYCDKTYKRKYGLIIHETSHTGETVYNCDICPNKYSQAKQFRNHYHRNHVDNGIFYCETCSKTFYKKKSLRSHQKIHIPQRKKYICGYCENSFLRKNTLSQHILRHINKKEYKCKLCLTVFLEKYLLTAHTNGSHTEYPCKICGKVYLVKKSLCNHMQTHKQIFRCDICGIQYSNNYKLNQHKNVHSKEVEYRCDICGKVYFQLGSFRTHSKRHKGAKTLQCSKCYKKFYQTVLLNSHGKICRKKNANLVRKDQ